MESIVKNTLYEWKKFLNRVFKMLKFIMENFVKKKISSFKTLW